MSQKPIIKPANDIPDLITWDDYETVGNLKRVRIRLSVTDHGLEIIADGPYPKILEELLESLEPKVIESLLCG